jgi:transcriptional regulator with XRE-family HTH domain
MKSIHPEAHSAVLKCLINARKRAKLTQQQLADRFPKPQSFVSKYENGARGLSLMEFIRIVHVMGADPLPLFKEIVDAAPRLKVRHRKRPRTV